MIDFLKMVNISDSTLIDMMKNNNEAILFNLSCNEDDALKIINYMQSIGINDIDDLLIYRIDIFTILFEQFIKKISKFNIPLLVEYVNSDYTNIDIINR